MDANCCGVEVADYEYVPDTTAEPSRDFRLLHCTQGEYLSFRPEYMQPLLC
jgi:hypothetical protein